MKIRKFYYYSPNKLKLIPIQNFVPKLVSVVVLIIFCVLMITTVLLNNYHRNNSIKVTQDKILESEYLAELNHLNKKYMELALKLDDLSKTTNDVRLSVNLEPLDFNHKDFGIGGAELSSPRFTSIKVNQSKLSYIYEYINNIETNLQFEKSNYEIVQDKFYENQKLFKCLPAIRPVKSSIGDRYGMRFHPILKRRRMHHGLDFLCNTGEEIIAPGDGTVTYIGRNGGYGKVIRINHGFGYETIYAHLSKYKVKKGQKIKRGDIIAISGNSGSLSTGPHLHYEVRHNGSTLNPRNFIFEEVKLFDKYKKQL